WSEEFWDELRGATVGNGVDIISRSFPTRVKEPGFRAWLDRAGRSGASPAAAARVVEANYRQTRDVPIEHHRIRIPTLVLSRPNSGRGDLARQVAAAIVGAQLVELPGDDELAIGNDVDALLAEIARFLTGEVKVPPPSRTLCAVLFTDLVSSTERAASVGDEQ